MRGWTTTTPSGRTRRWGCDLPWSGSSLLPGLAWRPSSIPVQSRPCHLTAVVQPSPRAVRLPGVQRWVNQHGLISLAGFRYRVPIVLAGEPVEAVEGEHLVRIFHRDVLVAEHVQRRKPDTGQQQE